MKSKKRKKEEIFYFLAFLVYTNVPNATATNATIKATTAAAENSLIVGTTTELLVGTKIACIATLSDLIVMLGLVEVYILYVVVEPTVVAVSQYRSLKLGGPVPGTAVNG